MKNLEELKNKTIGVFFGGRNAEHDISIITGEFTLAELKKMGMKVAAVYIGKDGKFYINQEVAKLKFFEDDFQKKLNKMKDCSLDLSGDKKYLEIKEKGFGGKNLQVDFAFPAFHGLFGEDGTIQGLFEFMNVPYVGCGIYPSSVGIDKIITKKFMESLDLQVTNYLDLSKEEYQKDKQKIINLIKQKLVFPVFVKPAKSGSSIGMSRVKSENDLEKALDLGFFYDGNIIVENGVENLKDLTCAVLSNGEEVIASEVQQSALSDEGFFDYDKKYMEDGGAQTGQATDNLIIPADISADIKNKIQNIAKKVFRELKCNGTARVDFLLNSQTGELFVNEINTLPGTLYHHLWEKSGKNIHEVLEWMLLDGLKREEQVQEISADFTSDVLNSANSMKLKIDN